MTPNVTGNLLASLESLTWLAQQSVADEVGLLDAWAHYAARDDAARILITLAKQQGKFEALQKAVGDREAPHA